MMAALLVVVALPAGVAGFWYGSGEGGDEGDGEDAPGGSLGPSCLRQRTFPAASSDIYVTGLIDVHGGVRCGQVDLAGVQLMEAARWTALKMGRLAFIPGVSLGVSIYDTCGGPEAVMRAAATAVLEGRYLEPPVCRAAPHVGVVHTHPHHDQLSSFLQDVGAPSVSVDAEDIMPQLEALVLLLQRLNWTSVAVAAPTIQELQKFGHLAAGLDICVGAEAILPHTNSDEKVYGAVLEALGVAGTGGVVLIGPQDRLHAALDAARRNRTDFHWVLAPTGTIQESVFQGLNSVASGLLVLKRTSQTVPEFGEHFLTVASSGSKLYQHFTPEDYVEEPAVYQMVKAMYAMGVGVRRAVLRACGGSGWCSNASATFTNIPNTDDGGDGPDVIEKLSIKAQRPHYQVLRLAPTGHDDYTTLAFTKVGHFSAGSLELENSLLEGPDRPPRYLCFYCRCLNVRFAFLADLRWRTEAWVTICATMAIIGFLLAVAISIFIGIRSCRGQAPEGSQGFSLLMLASCIFLYAAILPYSFEASTLTCRLRAFSTGLAYALVFAIMLSRSLMLATADSEGLVGHVSGLIQTALFFFMVSVQTGLGVQQWVIGTPSSIHTLPSGGVLYTCSGNRLQFIISQSYIMFLLALQLVISPFIIRSRRNYHEGLLFFIATVLMAGVWVAWATLYMILPPEWGEACICLGLAATPTCVLLTIFVPKTYLMVRAAAKESVCATPIRQIARPQPSQDLVRSSSLSLYDSIGHLPEMMHASPHAYGPDPTVHPPPSRKESPYEAYSHYQPSPHKITQF
nr:uncharacterized protein LOC123745986 [Procambarus clarkii]